jgi:hypothetical protein
MPEAKQLEARREEDRVRDEAKLFFRSVKRVVSFVNSSLLLFFLWLEFGIPQIRSIIAGTSPDLIWKTGLALYLASWIYGANNDIDLQDRIYTSIGKDQRWLIPRSITTVVIIGVVAFALAWTEGQMKLFAITLCVFVFVDHAAWRLFIYLTKPAVKESEKYYSDNADFVGLEKLEVIRYQLHGRWKWPRLCASIPITVLIVGFAFSELVQAWFVHLILFFVPDIPGPEILSFANGVLVLVFVLTMEGWHWVKRINTNFTLGVLDKLDRTYTLEKKVTQASFVKT